MRPLTNAEIDSIFGGDDMPVQTMDVVTVTAPRMTTTSGNYVPGDNSFYVYREETCCSWLKSYYDALYGAVPVAQVPSPVKLKCIGDKTAPPGQGPLPGFNYVPLNSRVWRNPALPYSQTNWIHSRTAPSNPAYNQQIGGLTIRYLGAYLGQGFTYIYAAGFTANPNGAGAYRGPDNVLHASYPGPFTALEQQAFTMAHEAFHQRYSGDVTLDEQMANYNGVQAVINVRAGKANSC